jgi:hypothetical protein
LVQFLPRLLQSEPQEGHDSALSVADTQHRCSRSGSIRLNFLRLVTASHTNLRAIDLIYNSQDAEKEEQLSGTSQGVFLLYKYRGFVARAFWLLYIRTTCEAAFITLKYRYTHNLGPLVGIGHVLHVSFTCV